MKQRTRNMLAAIISVIVTLAALLGLTLAGASPAGAQVVNGNVTSQNRVSNSGFSDFPLNVVGWPSGTDYVQPGQQSISTPTWGPTGFLLYSGDEAMYRLVSPDGWADQWKMAYGSIISGNVVRVDVNSYFQFFGCKPWTKPCEIQVIFDSARIINFPGL